jgi:hypothetical protein
VVSQDNFQKQIKDELRNALAYFIERQKLVAQAMMELGLDLQEVAEFKALAWASGKKSDIALNIEEIEDPYTRKIYRVAKRASERNLSQSGIWRDGKKNEWRYFLHGGGCRLTNSATGEPIDWNCSNVMLYDKYFFIRHLNWQISFPDRSKNFTLLQGLEKDKLESLIDEID